VAKWVWQLARVPSQPLPGDPVKGRDLYFNRGGCIQCHTIKGQGGAIGPELSLIGLRRSPAYLRRALLDPAADVPQSFSTYRAEISIPENFLWIRVATKDGREFAGVRLNEDTFSIQLRDLGGQIHSFFKSELSEIQKDWGKTPMPAYGAVFTPAETDDLVAFLASLRGET
jgi:putative heme-binding domain-containing protein